MLTIIIGVALGIVLGALILTYPEWFLKAFGWVLLAALGLGAVFLFFVFFGEHFEQPWLVLAGPFMAALFVPGITKAIDGWVKKRWTPEHAATQPPGLSAAAAGVGAWLAFAICGVYVWAALQPARG